jgi:acyl-coenzyme A thioesterase PaaI-like protein
MSIPLLPAWRRCVAFPGGKWLFSRLVCFTAPYFGSIRPIVTELDAEHCEVRIRKSRRVQNHLGTVHAIVMCNMAELAGGLLTDVATPATHRWIPKGMSVEYLKKAETDLRAVATLDGTPITGKAAELPVIVKVFDTRDQLVFRARIGMWVAPKK